MDTRPLDLLFVSEAPCWPLCDGVNLRGYHMVTALRRMGVAAALASVEPLPPDTPAELHRMTVPWPVPTEAHGAQLVRDWCGLGGRLRLRFGAYEGCDPRSLGATGQLVDRHRPKAVIALGRHHRGKRVWYAADEMIGFHLSCLAHNGLDQVKRHMTSLVQHGLLEQLFVRGLDGAIGVTDHDSHLLRWLAGALHTTTIQNGVDLDHYLPCRKPPTPQRLIFLGSTRLCAQHRRGDVVRGSNLA